MSRELLILRHAEAGWNDAQPTDFDRPLTPDGRAAAPRVGRWMSDQDLVPDFVVCSLAERARQTLDLVVAQWSEKVEISWDERLYSAEAGEMVQILGELPGGRCRVLMVGHNPGLTILLGRLARAEGHLSPGTLAHLKMPDDWRDLAPGCAALESITRPD